MKALVTRHFIDKDSLKSYQQGDTFQSTDSERISFLSKKGFVKVIETPEEEKKTVKRTRKKASE